MADASSFRIRVDPADKRTQDLILKTPFEHGQVIRPIADIGYLRAHVISEVTVTVVNTGQATDTELVNEVLSLLNVARTALFNSTIGTDGMSELYLLGLIFTMDHTTTSPDTDNGDVELEVSLGHQSGSAPTSVPANETWKRRALRFVSEAIVEVAGVKTEIYSEPVFVPVENPILVKKTETFIEYWAGFFSLHRITGVESRARVAQSAVTTYTFKLAAWVVLADISVLRALRARSPIELNSLLGL